MLLQAPVFERKREFQDWAQKGKRRCLKIKWRLISCYSLATLLNTISFPYYNFYYNIINSRAYIFNMEGKINVTVAFVENEISKINNLEKGTLKLN